MIKLTQLVKQYGDFTAVAGIDLEVPRVQLFGFLGPNGAGKTTTLRMIAGILRPTSGRVEIGGIDIAADPVAAKMKLGFIPDRPFIYEKLTGAEFLRFVAGLYDQEGAHVEHRARELLAAGRARRARPMKTTMPAHHSASTRAPTTPATDFFGPP